MSTPYEQGRLAHVDGKPTDACPYALEGSERFLWFAGWAHRNAECARHERWAEVKPFCKRRPKAA